MIPIKLFLKTIAIVAIAFLFGSLVAYDAGYPEHAFAAGLLVAAFCFIPQGKKMTGSLFTITATDVVTEWGAFFRQQGQTIQDIMGKLMQKSVTEAFFPRRITEQTILEKATAETSRVLQRFQKAFTPIGGVTFEPMKIQLYKLKIDLQDTPDDLEESWLGFLADNSLDRTQWPFMAWRLMMALKQQEKDLELGEIWQGVPGVITPGTATNAGTSLLGIRKQINDLNTASKLNLIALGAPPTDPQDFVDYVETMIEETDPLLRAEIDFMFMSEVFVNRYRDGMGEKYNMFYKQIDDVTKLKNYDIQLKKLPSMVGSEKIWYTPEWNRQMGLKKSGNPETFKVENVDRTVKAYTDYYKGFGFWIGEYVTSNDVDLT